MKIRNPEPLIAALAAAALALGALPAHAEGLYIGGSMGTPHYADSVNGVSGNGSGLSGKIFLGYQLTPYFGLEGGLADLGHVNDSTGTLNGHSQFLDAVGTLPLGDKWAALARLGVAHVNLDSSGGDSSGNGLKVGLGMQYSLSQELALRAEWERYRPDAFDEKPNIDQYTFGVRVNF